MKKLGIVLPNQLFNNSVLKEKCDEICLIEEFLFFRQYDFHKLKLVLHRSSMLAYKDHLESNGLKVDYIESGDKRALLEQFFKSYDFSSYQEILIHDPEDDWLFQSLMSSDPMKDNKLRILSNPGFINDKNRKLFSSTKKKSRNHFFDFYKDQRLTMKILIQADGTPIGGRWNFDKENRKKLPKGIKVPMQKFQSPDSGWKEAVAYVKMNFPHNPGTLNPNIVLAYNRKSAVQWMSHFLNDKLARFGDYEDAIDKRETFLFHSSLSYLLNIGLLLPSEVISSILDYSKKQLIPINSLEGLIRQIIGWREYARLYYVQLGRYGRTKNFLDHKRKIPKSFYVGNTGIEPLDDSIKKIVKYGYCHHIERLMIIGNFMLLCEFDPDEVYQWFMEMFIDSYDWVMVPNVYGMSQFSDGGLFATKPYISGSNYILKMSNYKGGEWKIIWDALYWRFIDKNRQIFNSNPRMKMMISLYDKMEAGKKDRLITVSDSFLEEIDFSLAKK